MIILIEFVEAGQVVDLLFYFKKTSTNPPIGGLTINFLQPNFTEIFDFHPNLLSGQ
jgi:hypothetical protein